MSTLDERVAADCERSGVPLQVEDEALLDRVAAMVAADRPEVVAVGRAR
jgi:hypothetical protein